MVALLHQPRLQELPPEEKRGYRKSLRLRKNQSRRRTRQIFGPSLRQQKRKFQDGKKPAAKKTLQKACCEENEAQNGSSQKTATKRRKNSGRRWQAKHPKRAHRAGRRRKTQHDGNSNRWGSCRLWRLRGLAERGFAVRLCEMKPSKMSPAHHSPDFAGAGLLKLLRGDRLENAVGLLKEELRRLGSLILPARRRTG